MLKKLKEAIVRCSEYQAAFRELDEGLKFDHANYICVWEVQVDAWETDTSKKNPYERQIESK
jgi:hypothetical protein